MSRWQAASNSRPWAAEYRLAAMQGGVAALAALVASFWGLVAAQSVLLGGVCALFPNVYFAWRVRRSTSAARVLLGVAEKLGLMVLMSATAFEYAPPAVPAGFFGGFVLVLLAHQVAAAGLRDTIATE